MDIPFKEGGGFKYLVPGHAYIVTQPFTDFDGRLHPVGERWIYHRAGFVPYYDGLTLFVQPESGPEWGIRMEWTAYGQGKVIDSLEEYITAER